jgi:hypothetical protein
MDARNDGAAAADARKLRASTVSRTRDQTAEIKTREPFRIHKAVNFHDLAARNCKAHHADGVPVHSTDHACGSVDEHRVSDDVGPRECERRACYFLRAPAHVRQIRALSPTVGAYDDIRIQHRHERVEVAPVCGSEERINHLSLAGESGIRRRR